jgi:hypothetical protein
MGPDPRAWKVSKLDARDAPRWLRRHADQALFLELCASNDLFQGTKLGDVREGEISREKLGSFCPGRLPPAGGPRKEEQQVAWSNRRQIEDRARSPRGAPSPDKIEVRRGLSPLLPSYLQEAGGCFFCGVAAFPSRRPGRKAYVVAAIGARGGASRRPTETSGTRNCAEQWAFSSSLFYAYFSPRPSCPRPALAPCPAARELGGPS